jgi:hypothetical protein
MTIPLYQVLDKTATLLASLGFGTIGNTPTANLFKMTMPESPTVCTVVVLNGGPVDPSDPTRRCEIQVLHRNTHIGSGMVFIENVYAALHNSWNNLPNIGGRFAGRHLPGLHFRNEADYPVFSQNFVFTTTFQ